MPAPMNVHEFSLVIDGLQPTDDEKIRELYDRVNDMTVSTDGATVVADVDRPAATLTDAIVTAIADLERIPGVRVLRVEPDEYVYASEIAGRTGRTRSSVDMLIAGKRGPGGFPRPISKAATRNPLWRWSDVAAWFSTYDKHPVDTSKGELVGAINGLLEARRVLPARDEVLDAARILLGLVELPTVRRVTRPSSRPKARTARRAD